MSYLDELDDKPMDDLGDLDDLSSDSPDLTDEQEKIVKKVQEMLEYINTTICRAPDEVSVKSDYSDGVVLYTLNVGDEDKGRVIGRNGRTAEAMRSLVRIAAIKGDLRMRLDIE